MQHYNYSDWYEHNFLRTADIVKNVETELL